MKNTNSTVHCSMCVYPIILMKSIFLIYWMISIKKFWVCDCTNALSFKLK